jgi:hypothetical protein
MTDLTAVPTADLYRELGRRRGAQGGRPPKLRTCPKCGAVVTAVQARLKCPH